MMSEESNITMPPEEMKECNEKNGEENNMFYLKWIWESILKKKDLTELLGNQQRKNRLVEGLWKTSQELEVKTCHKWKQDWIDINKETRNLFRRKDKRRTWVIYEHHKQDTR